MEKQQMTAFTSVKKQMTAFISAAQLKTPDTEMQTLFDRWKNIALLLFCMLSHSAKVADIIAKSRSRFIIGPILSIWNDNRFSKVFRKIRLSMDFLHLAERDVIAKMAKRAEAIGYISEFYEEFKVAAALDSEMDESLLSLEIEE